MTTQIVRATLDHLHDVAELFDAYRQWYGQAPDLERATTFITERLKQSDSVIFLAIHQSKGVGFTQLYPSFSSVRMRPIWILNDLFVAESARNTGVAKNLMNSAKQFAIETQAARLSLETANENQPAQALYEKLGWQKN
ncbi:MAG: GNAT family N-acetyltransferase, partial [Planctomycetaceae bacterium]|nr:GNAT family N-acetyltransferase [Planctomycetaceae bacterium]